MAPSALFWAPALLACAGCPPPVHVAPLGGGGSLAVPLGVPPPRSFNARPGRALLGGGAPSPLPPPSTACVRCSRPFRGALSSVASSVVSSSSCVLHGVSSPPPVLSVTPIDSSGLALTGPPTGAAGAAPVKCADEYLASFSSPPWLARAPLTGPPAAAAEAAPVGCAVGRPAPPACCSVPSSASSSSIAVTPRGAAPSPPLVGCSQLVWTVGGFSYPPPHLRPSSPHWDWDAVGGPRVSTPLGLPTSLGFELSHDDSNPLPFVFGVWSS